MGNAASMVNKISCPTGINNSSVQWLKSDTAIEVIIDIPFAFRAIPVELIESSGNQVLEQILKIMLPRFLMQNSLRRLSTLSLNARHDGKACKGLWGMGIRRQFKAASRDWRNLIPPSLEVEIYLPLAATDHIK